MSVIDCDAEKWTGRLQMKGPKGPRMSVLVTRETALPLERHTTLFSEVPCLVCAEREGYDFVFWLSWGQSAHQSPSPLTYQTM